MKQRLIELLKPYIKSGDFELTSRLKSDFYVDIKEAITQPIVLKKIISAIKYETDFFEYDRIAGLQLGGALITSVLSLYIGIPCIIIRPEEKKHGIASQIIGKYENGEKILTIDDVVSTGGSLEKAITLLRENELIANDAIVVVDREMGAKERLDRNNINLQSLVKVSELKHINF